MECRRWGPGRNQRIAAMNCVEAEFAVAGVTLGGVADEVANSDNLEDCQQSAARRTLIRCYRRGC